MGRLFHISNTSYSTTFEPEMEIILNSMATRRPIPGYSCPAHFLHDILLGKYPEWLKFPVIFRQNNKGEKFRDVLGDGMLIVLVSERMERVLSENNLTGWKVYPIELFDRRGERIAGYKGFSITGKGGVVEYPIGCPPERRPFITDPQERLYNLKQWDGSDFFTISGSPYVTERAMHVMKKAKISSLIYSPIENYYSVLW